MTIKKGDVVKVEYEGKFEDNTVFDSSSHGDHSHPLEFEVGAGQVIKGFDDAVVGMNEGDEKEFSIEPADAYGERDNEAIKEFPRDSLPEGQEIEAGGVLMASTPDGRQIPVKIHEVNDKSIKVDFNHPLAGKKLIFKIKIVGIGAGESPTNEAGGVEKVSEEAVESLDEKVGAEEESAEEEPKKE